MPSAARRNGSSRERVDCAFDRKLWYKIGVYLHVHFLPSH